MNKLEKLQEATQRMLLEKDNKSNAEVTSEVVLENTVQIPIITIIEAAIKEMEERASVTLKYIRNDANNVELSINGDDNHINAFKDIYGLSDNTQSLETDSALNKLKRQVEEVFNTLNVEYTYKLSRSSSDDDIMWFYFEVNVKDIPYPIKLRYSIYSSGDMKVRVECIGNEVKDERWSIPCYGIKEMVEAAYSIISYYQSQPKEISGE